MPQMCVMCEENPATVKPNTFAAERDLCPECLEVLERANGRAEYIDYETRERLLEDQAEIFGYLCNFFFRQDWPMLDEFSHTSDVARKKSLELLDYLDKNGLTIQRED